MYYVLLTTYYLLLTTDYLLLLPRVAALGSNSYWKQFTDAMQADPEGSEPPGFQALLALTLVLALALTRTLTRTRTRTLT